MATQVPFYSQAPMVSEGIALSEEERRLKELLDMLQTKKGATPINSGMFHTLNLEPLGDALEKRKLKGELDLTAKKKADFQGKYLEEVARRLRAFKQDEEGSSVPLPVPNDDEGNPMPAARTAGNQRAFKDYLADPYPEVKAVATEREKRYYERLKEALGKSSLGSIQTAGDDIQGLRPKPEWEINPGGVWDKSSEGRPRLVQGSRQEQLPGGAPGRMANVGPDGRMTAVGGEGNTTNVNLPGDRAGSQMLLATIPEEKKKIDRAVEQFRSAEIGLQKLAEGTKTGWGAQTLENVKSAVSYMTGIQFDSSANFGVLAAQLAANTIKELGGLGAQVSNTDRDFMALAVGGTMNTPEALERLLAIRAGHLRRAIEGYPDRIAAAAEGAESPAIQERIRQSFGIENPSMGLLFTSPEAEASFLAGWRNIPYPQALEQVRKTREQDKPASAWQADPKARQQRLEELKRKYGGGGP